MMKRLVLALAFFATTAAGPFSGAFTNGPSAGIDYFPIGGWYENPLNTAVGACGSGLTCTGTPNLSSAYEAMHINFFLNIYGSGGGGTLYPENNLGGGNWSDNGEMAQMKLHKQLLFGGVTLSGQANDQTTVGAVVSRLVSAGSISGNTGVLAGYNLGDEPLCGADNGSFQIFLENYPATISAIAGVDSTRPTMINMGFPPVLVPIFAFTVPVSPPPPPACNSVPKIKAVNYAAMTGVGAVSFDLYPTSDVFYTNPGSSVWNGASNSNGSDFNTVPMDMLWLQGLGVQNLRFISGSNAVGAYTQSGSNELGFSTNQNPLTIDTVSGNTGIVMRDTQYKFTAAYVGYKIVGTGIPAAATITAVADATHATLSAAATATSSGGVTATVAYNGTDGGVALGGCNPSTNLCLPVGNEYRPTAEQVNAEAWMSVISGANFLMYFCEDSTSITFCAGGAGTAPAIAASVNLAYVNGNIQSLAPVLNSATTGICQHRTMDISSGPPPTNTITIAGSCGNGILTLLSNTANMPGRAMVKSFGGVTYLFTQSDQRSPTVAGGSYTFTLAGLAGKTATVIYDSNQKYHPTYSAVRSSFVLNGSGAFTDVLGNHADYQVKIYAIQ